MNGYVGGFRPSNYAYCRIWIERFTSQPKTVRALTAVENDYLIYSGASDFEPRCESIWQPNGRIKLENEIIGYKTGFESGTKKDDRVTKSIGVPALSESIIVDDVYPFKYVQIEDEILLVQDTYIGGNGTINAVAVGDTKIGLSSFTGLYNPKGAYIVYAKIEDEWISYTGYDATTK